MADFILTYCKRSISSKGRFLKNLDDAIQQEFGQKLISAETEVHNRAYTIMSPDSQTDAVTQLFSAAEN